MLFPHCFPIVNCLENFFVIKLWSFKIPCARLFRPPFGCQAGLFLVYFLSQLFHTLTLMYRYENCYLFVALYFFTVVHRGQTLSGSVTVVQHI